MLRALKLLARREREKTREAIELSRRSAAHAQTASHAASQLKRLIKKGAIALLVAAAVSVSGGCAAVQEARFQRAQQEQLAMLQERVNRMPNGKDKLMAQVQLAQLEASQQQAAAARVAAWSARASAIQAAANAPVYTPPTVIPIQTSQPQWPVWTPPIIR